MRHCFDSEVCIVCQARAEVRQVGVINICHYIFCVRCMDPCCGTAFILDAGYVREKRPPLSSKFGFHARKEMLEDALRDKEAWNSNHDRALRLMPSWLDQFKKVKRGIACPDCSAKVFIRKSEFKGLFRRSYFLQCDNFLCSAGFEGVLNIEPPPAIDGGPAADVLRRAEIEDRSVLGAGRSLATGLFCYLCNGAVSIRSSEKISSLFFRVYMRCGNGECGWRYKATFEFSRILALGFQPDPYTVKQLAVDQGAASRRSIRREGGVLSEIPKIHWELLEHMKPDGYDR